MQDKKEIWFRAKTYGWGWYPCTWQGWIVLLIFLLVHLLITFKLGGGVSNQSNLILKFTLMIIWIAILLVVCYKKGEKPRWRWGK